MEIVIMMLLLLVYTLLAKINFIISHNFNGDVDERYKATIYGSVNDEFTAKFAINRNRQYISEMKAGSVEMSKYVEGDLRLTPLLREIRAGDNQAAMTFVQNMAWLSNIIPFTIDAAMTPHKKGAIESAMKDFENYTVIRFIPRTNEPDYINFIKHKDGCWSFVGRQGGKQDVSIGIGCGYRGTVIHEIMHALGFFHENTRLDRDKYLSIVKPGIAKGFEGNFRKYKSNLLGGNPMYDYFSIMQLDRRSFGRFNIFVTMKTIDDAVDDIDLGQRQGFSQMDVNRLKKVYGKYALNDKTQKPPVEKPTGAVPPNPEGKELPGEAGAGGGVSVPSPGDTTTPAPGEVGLGGSPTPDPGQAGPGDSTTLAPGQIVPEGTPTPVPDEVGLGGSPTPDPGQAGPGDSTTLAPGEIVPEGTPTPVPDEVGLGGSPTPDPGQAGPGDSTTLAPGEIVPEGTPTPVPGEVIPGESLTPGPDDGDGNGNDEGENSVDSNGNPTPGANAGNPATTIYPMSGNVAQQTRLPPGSSMTTPAPIPLLVESQAPNCASSYPCWPPDYVWSYDGLPPSCNCPYTRPHDRSEICKCNCVKIHTEKSNNEWKNNLLCFRDTMFNPNFEVSLQDKQPTRRCLKFPPLTKGFENAFLCTDLNVPYRLFWSNENKKNCLKMSEPEDKKWGIKYLCDASK